MAFLLCLEAYDYEEIATVMGVRKSRVHQLIEECAQLLIGDTYSYPQNEWGGAEGLVFEKFEFREFDKGSQD